MENQNGVAFIQSAQQVIVPNQQTNQGGDLVPPNQQSPIAGEEKPA